MTTAEIRVLVATFRDIVSVLATADPEAKRAIHQNFGLRLTYEPDSSLVRVEASPPRTPECVGGGT
jgi:hypothetical protein